MKSKMRRGTPWELKQQKACLVQSGEMTPENREEIHWELKQRETCLVQSGEMRFKVRAENLQKLVWKSMQQDALLQSEAEKEDLKSDQTCSKEEPKTIALSEIMQKTKKIYHETMARAAENPYMAASFRPPEQDLGQRRK